MEEASTLAKKEPDLNSHLAWLRFMNAPSVLRFLKEKMQQKPMFKQQLLDYIEESKRDKKRLTAANAMTFCPNR